MDKDVLELICCVLESDEFVLSIVQMLEKEGMTLEGIFRDFFVKGLEFGFQMGHTDGHACAAEADTSLSSSSSSKVTAGYL